MRIVVTGVTGQVGRALVTPLARLGTVIPTDRSAFNLADPAMLASALDRLVPDLIINPGAAYTAVDRAEDEQDLAFVDQCATSPGVIAAVGPRAKRRSASSLLDRLCVQRAGRSAVARGQPDRTAVGLWRQQARRGRGDPSR